MNNPLKPDIVLSTGVPESERELKLVEQDVLQSKPGKRHQRKRPHSGSDHEHTEAQGQLIPPALSSHVSSRSVSTDASPRDSPFSLSLVLPSLNLDVENAPEVSGSRQQIGNRNQNKLRQKKIRAQSAQDTSSAPGASTGQLDLTDTNPQPSPSTLSVVLPENDSEPETEKRESRAERQKKRNRVRNAERRSKAREIQRARDLILFACADVMDDTVRNWSNEEVLERAKEVEGKILEGTDGEIWLVDLDRREQSRTPDKMMYDGKEPDLSKEKLESGRWTILNRGVIYGYRTVDEQKVLVFAAKFSPYDRMSPEDLDDMRFLAKHFYKLGKLFHSAPSNEAIAGVILAESWQVAYEALFSLSLYKKSQNGQGTPEEYAEFLDETERASAICAKRYKELAPREYLHSLGFMEESCVPRFGTVEPETKAERSMGGNLTVTWGDSCNKYRKADNAQHRAAGSWLVITDEGDLVTDPDLIRNAVEEGYFALPTFKFAVDFSQCPGVVDLMWSSEDDFHAISQSVTKSGFRRIGSFMQIPKRVVDATLRMKDIPIDL
ncbi:hypothetical protein RSOL_006280 [Rhizoctonia solani AG-3 Rhs1AP]|uniref:Tet-like 2OG-Fe(II) oxygenase domain-containing protein n=1 Tax=Rhizoctonia solani AG-3 Rhs1AP TaxID=1086054 RepID=X8IWU9_9AGAM|nr:hypothetical protein RSOL_006280 [Rhizoctonia solani AG-3 Rhs1AP]